MSNLLKDKYPKIFKELETSLISENFDKLSSYSHKKVWWKCSKGHSYEAIVSNRTRAGSGCPYCSNKKAGYGNDLKSKKSYISKGMGLQEKYDKTRRVSSLLKKNFNK